MAILIAVARTLPLLDGLSEVDQARVAALMSEQVFSRREVILKKNDPGTALCFLIDGRLQAVDFTLDGREVGLFFIEPKQTFGELALVDDGPQPEFVISVARSRVAFLPAEEAKHLLTQYPAVANTVLRRVAQRLRSVTDQRTLIALPNPVQRVCVQLVKLSSQHGVAATARQVNMPPVMVESPAPGPDGGPSATGRRLVFAPGPEIDVVLVREIPTHQEIAIMINTSRETVTRVFQMLTSKGIIARVGPDMVVKDMKYLHDLAAGRADAGTVAPVPPPV